MNLLFAAVLCWCCLGSCRGDDGCIVSETSNRRAIIKEGFPGTVFLLREGELERVFLRMFMKRIDVGLEIKTITLQQEDLPLNKRFQDIIISSDSEGHPSMSLPNITERTFTCCRNFEIEKLEVQSEGGGVWLFYRCPETMTKRKLQRITSLSSEGSDKAPPTSSANGRPQPPAYAWVPLVLALACCRIDFV
ncbi:uncharacterized protein LOC134780830 [Penaeus indicus]|uniref:uncharacterized protein LOC134780830 n=1 Tax=Penaeus indicus TaxID=29960 RepID=UPI00300C614E